MLTAGSEVHLLTAGSAVGTTLTSAAARLGASQHFEPAATATLALTAGVRPSSRLRSSTGLGPPMRAALAACGLRVEFWREAPGTVAGAGRRFVTRGRVGSVGARRAWCLQALGLLRFELAQQVELGGELGAELVGEHAALDQLHLALGQVEQLERAERDADQAADLEAERAEDLADLAVLAFAKADGQPGVGALEGVDGGLDRAVLHALDLDALLQLVEIGLRDAAACAHPVAAQPAGFREFEMAGQLAVVGQQQQALGVEVEPADGDDARQLRRQLVEDGGAAFGVGVGGDEAARLVVAPEAQRLGHGQGLAVDQDLVARPDVERGCGQQRAVDADAAFGDPTFGLAARAEPGAGHDLGDAHRLGGLWRGGLGRRMGALRPWSPSARRPSAALAIGGVSSGARAGRARAMRSGTGAGLVAAGLIGAVVVAMIWHGVRENDGAGLI